MSNTFITSADIAAVAAVQLLDAPTLLQSSYRNASVDMSASSGGVVKVRKPITTTTGRFTGAGTYVNQDVEESFASITCNETFYQRMTLTSAEMALSINDFNANIVTPAVNKLTSDIEAYLLKVLALGAGTKDFTAASDWSGVLAKIKYLNLAKLQSADRAGYISPTTEAAFMTLEPFANASYRGENGSTKTGNAGVVAGVNWQRTNNILSPVAVTGTIKASAAATTGATSVALKGITGSKVYAGSYMTVSTAKYLITADAVVTAGAATVTLQTGLAADLAADDAVGIVAKNWNVLVGDPSCLAVVMAPLQPTPGLDCSIRSEKGISLRVSLGTDLSTLSTVCTIECLLGASVIVPDGVVAFVE